MDPATFFHHLQRSKLLSPAQLTAAAEHPSAGSAAGLARALEAEGVLTGYQAEQLLAGKSRGFVLGPYRILDYLGQGATAYIFKAAHTATQQVVAVKVLKPEVLGNPEAHESFWREIRAAGRLRHPNIVAAYDAGKSGKAYYLVLEYVDGVTLKRLVRRGGRLPIPLACEVVRQATEVLHYAHAQGVVHRDIKPGNLLIAGLPGGRAAGPPPGGWPAAEELRKSVTVKVFDFGIARLRKPRATTLLLGPGEVCGTPDFIAPEQAQNAHAADVRSDLYSLGCTLYFALAGKPPFPGATALEKLLGHQMDEPTPLERRRPEVPARLAAIVRRLLDKDPARRFQTAGELAEALAPWAAGRCGIAMNETSTHSLFTPQGGSSAEAGRGWVLEKLVSP
jgi:serine/threonine protein kinase